MRKIIATASCALMLGAGLPLPARAALIGSDQLLQQNSTARATISGFLARAEVRRELAARGVNPADVQARVSALSDEEARDLAARIDQLPAGGDGVGDVLGALVLIFVILLITDILGWTKVFPFTRPIHR
ncbi:MAG TPA: PA2779 family protein [Burkholderiaceae bacterium]|jgi:hypothetical protein|nr:PA2779 family protein [Burkholderiaceae bacterium]